MAALVSCRTLDNKQPDNTAYDSNRPAALTAAKNAVTGSPYMAGTLSVAPDPVVRAGTYDYDATSQTFIVNYYPLVGQYIQAVLNKYRNVRVSLEMLSSPALIAQATRGDFDDVFRA